MCIWSWTTTARTKPLQSNAGWLAAGASHALHVDLRLAAQSGRALFRDADRAALHRGTHRSTVELQQAIRSYLQVCKRGPRSIRSSTASNDSACDLLTQDSRPLALVMLCTALQCWLLRRQTIGMTLGGTEVK